MEIQMDQKTAQNWSNVLQWTKASFEDSEQESEANLLTDDVSKLVGVPTPEPAIYEGKIYKTKASRDSLAVMYLVRDRLKGGQEVELQMLEFVNLVIKFSQ